MFWNNSFSKTAVIAVLFIVLCVSSTISAKNFSFELSSTANFVLFTNFEDDENEIFELVNEERRRKRLNDLQWNVNLSRLARAYSRKMAKESFFGHYDRDGKSVAERASEANIRGWKQIGENLFYCEAYNDFSNLAVNGWMKSDGHRRNILNRNFTSSGIGIARSRSGEIYVTQVFIQD